MDNLLACESAGAHGSGTAHMKAEVMNCYLQFSRGAASSLSIIGNAKIFHQAMLAGGSGSGSTSTTHHAGFSTTHHAGSSTTHHAGSSTTHTNSHHHSATNPSGLEGRDDFKWLIPEDEYHVVEFISFSFSFLND